MHEGCEHKELPGVTWCFARGAARRGWFARGFARLGWIARLGAVCTRICRTAGGLHDWVVVCTTGGALHDWGRFARGFARLWVLCTTGGGLHEGLRDWGCFARGFARGLTSRWAVVARGLRAQGAHRGHVVLCTRVCTTAGALHERGRSARRVARLGAVCTRICRTAGALHDWVVVCTTGGGLHDCLHEG